MPWPPCSAGRSGWVRAAAWWLTMLRELSMLKDFFMLSNAARDAASGATNSVPTGCVLDICCLSSCCKIGWWIWLFDCSVVLWRLL